MKVKSINIDLDKDDLSECREHFLREGFLVLDFNFSDKIIEDCRDATANFIGRAGRIQDLWRRQKAVKNLGAHPDVLSFLGKLYDREAFPFQTLNFTKGTEQSTHADTLFFDSSPKHFMCGVWVALEDIDMENGPLFYYERSHSRPVAHLGDIEASSHDTRDEFFANESRNYKKTYALIKKGQAIIWASNLLHGGSPVKDRSRTRLSQVTHYYFKDCAYHTPILENTKTNECHWRAPYDFAAGKFIWSKNNEKTYMPRPRHLVSDIADQVFRRTPTWEQ